MDELKNLEYLNIQTDIYIYMRVCARVCACVNIIYSPFYM